MNEYLIWREGDGPDPIGDANRLDEFWHSVFEPAEALHDYLICGDMNSHFIDGYPEGEIYCALDIQTGEIHQYRVNTEFNPCFNIGAAK